MALLYWLCYNCVLALLPVVLVAGYLWVTKAPVSLMGIVRDGQLFFYCAALAAAAIGDLLLPRHALPISPMGLAFDVFGLVLCIILSCWFFGISSGNKGIVDDSRLASISYIFTVGATGLVASVRWSLDLL